MLRSLVLSLAAGGCLAGVASLARADPVVTATASRASLRPSLPVESGLSERLRSALGLGAMIGVACLLSTARRRIRWRLVVMGVSLQIALGVLTQTGPGLWLFSRFNDAVVALLAYSTEGSAFLFGDLARAGHPAYLAFGVLPTIIFFSSLMGIFYHLGIMQALVRGIAWLMQRTMGTSGAETLSAAGNVFFGQTEAPLLVRPFLKSMTVSELMAVMTGGFATVAGGVMIAYVGMLQGIFPNIAGHLLSASIMSAPAALVIAKIMVPETEQPETLGAKAIQVPSSDVNVLDAAARGAAEGLKLCLNVGAMLLAFTALVACANGLLAWGGEMLGTSQPVTLERILGGVGAPIAWLMGIAWADAGEVGALLGVKTILNEFVAYVRLAEVGGALNPRSLLIATYALCGFANLASIGIQLGGISPLAPERRPDLARLALRAMIGGTLSGFMTACIIGIIV